MNGGLMLRTGMRVRVRGEHFIVLNLAQAHGMDGQPLVRLELRRADPALPVEMIEALMPIEAVEPDPIPEPSLDNPGRLARFRLLHQAFALGLASPTDRLASAGRARINLEPYQFVPAARALSLPRPRLLLADDVGLGKTIEAGLILCELTQRRRATRVLIVTPAGIMEQWQEELRRKFGFRFTVFDADRIAETRARIEAGANPWTAEVKIIASMDLVKRREGAFRELSATRWDVIIVDEAHHLAAGRSEDDVTDRHRLARWLAEAGDALLLLTATPHDGFDEGFGSLLALLEPNLVIPGRPLQYERYRAHIVRRLKPHIRKEDGSPKFLSRTVEPLAVDLTAAERNLHAAVMAEAGELELAAERSPRGTVEAQTIRLVATILRKRAASSRAALEATLAHRRENLAEAIDEIEVQRDHLRALRRGETVPDNTLARLERDAHRNYLAVIRRLGRQVRRAESEDFVLTDLERLLRECEGEPESRMTTLLAALRGVHRASPEDKVIVFSEYADTVASVAGGLGREADYTGRVVVLTGDLAPKDRGRVLVEFEQGDTLVLVATDAGGEGLNLQRRCHRIIHFDLPWNPNRMEQRNGRVDRYGQTAPPVIGFLYARETYDGEVIRRLVEKIERQMRSLGSVGDVLGRIQADRIEAILARVPKNVAEAVRQADREIDEEIRRVDARRIRDAMGDGVPDEDELRSADEARERGASESVNLVDFLAVAVEAAGGRVTRGRTLSVQTPASWLSTTVQAQYEGLVGGNEAEDGDITEDRLIQEEHPLVSAALRWVKSTRFDPRDDPRLAYVRIPWDSEPDLVASFIVRLRDGEGQNIERIEAVRVNAGGEVSRDAAADMQALRSEGPGNVDTASLVRLFGEWWELAHASAESEARRRAEEWRRAVISARGLQQMRWQDEIEAWDRACRDAILGEYAREYGQKDLFGREASLPAPLKRKLEQHRQRAVQRREFLRRRVEFEPAVVEPLGILLRVPEDGGAN